MRPKNRGKQQKKSESGGEGLVFSLIIATFVASLEKLCKRNGTR